MSRMSRPPSARRLAAALALVHLFSGPVAFAQYRPPPLTESQLLVKEAETAQVSASAAVTAGNKKEAEEKNRKALQLFEQALTLDPTSAPAAAGLGATANALGDYARVAAKLPEVSASHPEDVSLTFPLGVALFKLRRFQEAVPLLEKVSENNAPEHLIVNYYLGSYYLHGRRGDVAIAKFQRYLAQRPPKLAVNDFQIHELIGQGHLMRKDVAAARAAFQQAQAGRPESVTAQMGLASVLEAEGRDEEALTLVEGLVDRFPQAKEPKERLGRMFLRSGNVAGAEKQALALVKLEGTPAAHLLLGDVRLAQKQPKEAEAEFRKVLELAPGVVAAQIAVGKALQAQGRNEEAIKYLEAALETDGGNLELWASLGSVNRRAGRFQRAVEVHRRLVELAPQQALGHVLLGADHFATGQWDQAIEDYSNALRVEPNHPGAQQWLAQSLAHRARGRADSNRLDDAVRDLRRAYDLERSAAMARRLGAALLEQRAFAQARPVLEQGVTLEGATWREHWLLGYAHLGEGNAEAALRAFVQAEKRTEEPSELADVSVGAALAEVELGRVDDAVERLSEPGPSKAARQLAEANLPLMLLRRALTRLESADVENARKDVELTEKFNLAKQPELAKLALLTKALVQTEQGRFAEATPLLKRALTPTPAWADANTRFLAEAYVLYRKGQVPFARKALAAASKKPSSWQAKWIASLSNSLHRLEGERAYATGNFKLAEKAFKAALAGAQEDAALQHNLACVNYGKRKFPDAVAVWHKLETSVPMASFNLGIEAQRRNDIPEAVESYRRYLASGGPRAATAREWRDRLMALHGLGGAASSEATEATATETLP
ncbi:tetratricopeptide repeat protein [Stigmatella sp. ncwal1]|uniref:Tetratricopeptide repeat protein n=1 Tax=Stigmatella ashevillensis TaxID=2995309 RepID=A0ABT5D3H8_9BACT|nr:tetratricopeptide repeat protein [Stigmatella ashevillena]MDC0708220.1 tetratricopeptide repeat protein [Stigmatella ashevillena]